MSAPPVFHNLKNSLLHHVAEARQGLSFLAGCTIANPDGTGFGNGVLEVETINPLPGDELRLRARGDIGLHDDEISSRGKVIARSVPVDDAGAGVDLRHVIRVRFEPAVFFEAVAALASSIEFVNHHPVGGIRNFAIRITDADADTATAYIDLDLRANTARPLRGVPSRRPNGTEPFGVLYVGISGWWQREVLRSQLSLRHHNPGIRTAVVIGEGSYGDVFRTFDYVITMKTGEYHPYTDKARRLLLTPFQTTLFLDSDTHVRGNIEHLPQLLGEHAIAVTDAPWCDMAMSSGVILYERNRAAPMISDWIGRMCAATQSDIGFFEETRLRKH
jgi:hypothetical protein